MAKTNKPKKSNIKKPNDEVKVNRGRPSTTKEKIIESVKETKKPQITEEQKLFNSIYGNEPLKDFIPIPNSHQKTETTSIISEYAIEVGRLPQNILDLVNAFSSDFSTFVSNPNMFQLIPEIQAKGIEAHKALKDWVSFREEALSLYKTKTQGGISVTKEESNKTEKIVIDTKNISNVIDSLPSKSEKTPETKTVTPLLHGQQQLIARETNGGSYQHHIHSNPINPNPNISGNSENKNIHSEMMSKSTHHLDVHKHQNAQYTPEVETLRTPKKYLEDYAKSIMDVVLGAWQINSWGYIPMDILKGILSSADNSFGYQVIQGDDNDTYLKISKGSDLVVTEKFKCV